MITDNRPVLFIDSGIGGLPYCMEFRKNNPYEPVCYLADTENFPYGTRTKEELSSILAALTEKLLITVNPKIIVLACNTATISALASLRERFPQIPFVGTVPALKPAAKTSKNGKVGILGTAVTIKEIHNLHLADTPCKIFGVAAPELVEFIEQRFDDSDENEKTGIAGKYIDIFRKEGADSLVLGCTHFLFLHDEFRREAAPDIEVFGSLEGITKRIEYLLDENEGALRSKNNFCHEHSLLLTGKEGADMLWKNRARTLDFKLKLLIEL